MVTEVSSTEHESQLIERQLIIIGVSKLQIKNLD